MNPCGIETSCVDEDRDYESEYVCSGDEDDIPKMLVDVRLIDAICWRDEKESDEKEKQERICSAVEDAKDADVHCV